MSYVAPLSLSPVAFTGSLLLGCAWLLPNHYFPWLSFHADAWTALILLLVAGFVVIGVPKGVRWYDFHFFIIAVALIPVLQHTFGLVRFFGDAWIAGSYVFGFLLALFVGARWEEWRRSEPGDFIFLAIGIAATVSVGLQLFQWLQLGQNRDFFDLWILQLDGGRPYANLSQPNQLATLLLWGVCASGWGFVRGWLRWPTAMVLAVFLITGVALTQSRTALVSLTLLLSSAWYFRRRWKQVKLYWGVAGLVVWYIFVSSLIQPISNLLHLVKPHSVADRIAMGDNARLSIWRMFFDALSERPLLGYGWNQTSHAQLNVALEHPGTHGVLYEHSHNIFLELIVWNGIPIGIAVSVMLVVLFFSLGRRISSASQFVLISPIIVVLTHALFEFPLHYAYFLLPFGVILGVLYAQFNIECRLISGRWVLTSIWLSAAVMFFVTVLDYSKVERDFFALRFKENSIGVNHAERVPSVIALSQLREIIKYGYFVPTVGLDGEELEWMRAVTRSYPSPSNIKKLATALAMNGYQDEAEYWINIGCVVIPREQCQAIKLLTFQ